MVFLLILPGAAAGKNAPNYQTHLQAGINLVAEEDLFWELADTFASDVDYDSTTEWMEVYIKPAMSFVHKTSHDQWEGRMSMVASGTVGTDAFDTGDTGRITLEEAFLGYRHNLTSKTVFGLSLGARELKLGTGMLLANGGVSGFERGSLKLGPRKAWERSLTIDFQSDGWKGLGFYLDPNELDSNNTNTKLAGVDLRHDCKNGDFIGATAARVIDSGAPYPVAAPGGLGPPSILQAGRDGLEFLNLYSRFSIPFGDALYFTEVEGALQQNDRIDLDAWGGRIKAGFAFQTALWQPTFTYSWQTFSGDDPTTDTLERFDPLYFEGSPSSWSTGSKSSMVFINSNVQSHHLTLTLLPSVNDFLTLRYAHIRANELGSPVQFGQAARVVFSDDISTVISGVTRGHLADDFFIEYTHVYKQSTYISFGISVSLPGKGIEAALGADGPEWVGGFLNAVVYL